MSALPCHTNGALRSRLKLCEQGYFELRDLSGHTNGALRSRLKLRHWISSLHLPDFCHTNGALRSRLKPITARPIDQYCLKSHQWGSTEPTETYIETNPTDLLCHTNGALRSRLKQKVLFTLRLLKAVKKVTPMGLYGAD